jgi:hypothetical protein
MESDKDMEWNVAENSPKEQSPLEENNGHDGQSEEQELCAYMDSLSRGDERFSGFDKFEVKGVGELPVWSNMKTFFEEEGIREVDSMQVIVVDDADFWKKFYGSNDSKSSYKPKAIILKKELFDSEETSSREESWLAHEIGHMIFYDSLGDTLEQYMQDYYARGEYTDSKMEKFAFQLQFGFMKSRGVTKEGCVDFVEEYLDESFDENETDEKEKERRQLMKYIQEVYPEIPQKVE